MKKRIAILFVPLLLLVALVVSSLVGDTRPDEARSEAAPAEFAAVESLPGQAVVEEDAEPAEAQEDEEVEEAVPAQPAKTTTVEPDPPRPAVERKPAPVRKKARTYKAAVLQIVTNFEKADVTVNGLKYPEYFEPGEPEGMVLPAGGPYAVLVKFGEKSKHYTVNLRPHETRLLVVELSGYNSGAPRPAPVAQRAEPQKKPQQKKEDVEKPDPKAPGRITVYSKPAGTVVVDGKATGDKTPGTVELENGRHEVQVQYETGSISEKKIVRVRTGSRIKLFFRERTQQ